MGWELVVGLNTVIALCYAMISFLVLRGLVATGQLTSNPLALATAAIFTSCGLHHGGHALHVAESTAQLRSSFGSGPAVGIDVLGAVIAVVYLSMRGRYSALLRTPSMFGDAVRDRAEERLREIAYADDLTGIPNRAALNELADRLASPGASAAPVAVAFLDLDGFKPINDRLGHAAGDRLLREVAQRLVTLAPAGVRVFRLGGDEFVAVLQEEAALQCETVAGALLALIEQPLSVRDHESVTLSASLGLALGLEGEHLDVLIRRADAAMYLAKRTQRGLVSFDVREFEVPAPRDAETDQRASA